MQWKAVCIAMSAGLIFGPSSALAQITSSVFSPTVSAGHRTVELRSSFQPGQGDEPDREAHRLHVQTALNGDHSLRLIAQGRSIGDGALDADFLRLEWMWQLTPDAQAYQTGLRFDVTARDGARPEGVGIIWANQMRTRNGWTLRGHLSGGLEIGDRARDGLLIGTRASVSRKVGDVTLGLEHFGQYGSTQDWLTADDQTHQFGPSATFELSDDVDVYLNWLGGLTESSPDAVLRFRISRSF
jgi:hypothetical protein